MPLLSRPVVEIRSANGQRAHYGIEVLSVSSITVQPPDSTLWERADPPTKAHTRNHRQANCSYRACVYVVGIVVETVSASINAGEHPPTVRNKRAPLKASGHTAKLAFAGNVAHSATKAHGISRHHALSCDILVRTTRLAALLPLSNRNCPRYTHVEPPICWFTRNTVRSPRDGTLCIRHR